MRSGPCRSARTELRPFNRVVHSSDRSISQSKLLRPCGWQSFSKHPPDRRSLTRTIDVWAEVRWGDGSRSRVGSPVVAEIIARDPSLSEVYHETTPDLDHALLEEALASRLATMSLGAEDPEMRGQRLASILLPDVIRWHAWEDRLASTSPAKETEGIRRIPRRPWSTP